jgi:quinol monooxygenase YgiN
MILVSVRMKVIAEKRSELCQTIVSLIGSLRTEKGCRRCEFCQCMEDENELRLLEEWDTREDLNKHLKSDLFKVLRGAMYLLQQPYEIRAHTVAREKKVKTHCRPAAKSATDEISDQRPKPNPKGAMP